MSDLIIRPVSLDEFAVAVEWAAGEGWNPGLDDLGVFFDVDRAGFLMGFVEDRPVSSISVVRYRPDYGFLGFYIVHPDYRGTGAGYATWQAGMAHLADCTVGLDGVVAQQDNYRKSGFALAGRNIRHTGIVASLPHQEPDGSIEPIGPQHLAMVQAFDRKHFGVDRSGFVRDWTLGAMGDSRTSLVHLEDGMVSGYGTVRRCRQGYKIGPLFAIQAGVAERLLLALIARIPNGSEISLDVPEDNLAAVDLAQRAGLSPVFETARMYRGPSPRLPLQQIYGITTFELG